jgi:hypothetical protein
MKKIIISFLFRLSFIMGLMSIIGFILVVIVSIYTKRNIFKENRKEISLELVTTSKALRKNYLFSVAPFYPYKNDSTSHDTINYEVKYFSGKVTKQEIYFKDYTESLYYFYDKNGNNNKISYFHDSSLIYTLSQRFNNTNKEIERNITYQRSNEKIIYVYNKFGFEEESKTYNELGNLTSVISTKYNLNGLKTKYIVDDKNNSSKTLELFNYDNKSNLIESKSFVINNGKYGLIKIKKYHHIGSENFIESIINIDGTFQTKFFLNSKLMYSVDFKNGNRIKTKYKYDSHGNLIEERSNKFIYNWYYSFDRFGNWKEIRMFKNGEFQYIKERNIIY